MMIAVMSKIADDVGFGEEASEGLRISTGAVEKR